jgi:hypothetical protein
VNFEMMLIVQKKPGFYLPLLAVLVCLGLMSARATTFLTLQSTFLGGGWFQYQMSVMNDPFFTEADITELAINFTNQIGQIDGANGWSYQGTNGWEFTNSYPARPYSETFLVQSSETSYRLSMATNYDGALVLMSLVLAEINPAAAEGIISDNIVGYANMPCLIPCSPDEADGSPTNFVFTLKLLPDISINQLIQTNGQIYGVDFTWDSAATFLLQGSADMNLWTNVAYIWSYPPETVWTTNTPLNASGQFFRMAMVAADQTTNLPPLSSSLALAPKKFVTAGVVGTTPKVTSFRLSGGKAVVNLATHAGQTVLVEAVNAHGAVLQTQQVTAQGPSTTVKFDATTLPSPVFFKTVVQI